MKLKFFNAKQILVCVAFVIGVISSSSGHAEQRTIYRPADSVSVGGKSLSAILAPPPSSARITSLGLPWPAYFLGVSRCVTVYEGQAWYEKHTACISINKTNGYVSVTDQDYWGHGSSFGFNTATSNIGYAPITGAVYTVNHTSCTLTLTPTGQELFTPPTDFSVTLPCNDIVEPPQDTTH